MVDVPRLLSGVLADFPSPGVCLDAFKDVVELEPSVV